MQNTAGLPVDFALVLNVLIFTREAFQSTGNVPIGQSVSTSSPMYPIASFQSILVPASCMLHMARNEIFFGSSYRIAHSLAGSTVESKCPAIDLE